MQILSTILSHRISRLILLPTAVCGTLLVCLLASSSVQMLWFGMLLCLLLAIVADRIPTADKASVSLLETPFYLSHDHEVFQRYRSLSQSLLCVSQRLGVVYRELALQRLDEMTTEANALAQGRIDFTETETWRIAYEKLLRDPTVFIYRSVALVRHPQYWKDAPGLGSMLLNFQLIDEQIVNVERIVIIADELWPRGEDMPVEELRQWIHEQSVHGIWIRLARLSDLRTEPNLVRDFGIYGKLAVGTQEMSDDFQRTHRFRLKFDPTAVRQAELDWDKLEVYSIGYKTLLDRFELRE
ncbi:MAG: hypothetical protein SFV81_15775 [Pirellulaceae bacterium]|nr:hypothetical protein [Pirellulaceae bacterium]